MAHETIIIELLSRIKILEEEVAAMKEILRNLQNPAGQFPASVPEPRTAAAAAFHVPSAPDPPPYDAPSLYDAPDAYPVSPSAPVVSGNSAPVSAPVSSGNSAPVSAPVSSGTSYMKMTEPMITVCYTYGRKAFQTPNASIGDYADAAAKECGVNRNSAFMYIGIVRNMLEGVVYKRAISLKAIRLYFSAIYQDFGAAGLDNAIRATREHAAYRIRCGMPADSILALCDEFQNPSLP